MTPATDREAITDALTLAFCQDPPSRYLWPEAADFLACFPRFVDHFAGGAFEPGGLHLAAGGGAALCLPPGTAIDATALRTFLRCNVAVSRLAEAEAIFGQMAQYAPAEPHWHLALLGVDPARQGQGCGTRLLSRVLARVDQNNELIYLENSNPRNVSLYERHGFRIIRTVRVADYPPLDLMLRGKQHLTQRGPGRNA